MKAPESRSSPRWVREHSLDEGGTAASQAKREKKEGPGTQPPGLQTARRACGEPRGPQCKGPGHASHPAARLGQAREAAGILRTVGAKQGVGSKGTVGVWCPRHWVGGREEPIGEGAEGRCLAPALAPGTRRKAGLGPLLQVLCCHPLGRVQTSTQIHGDPGWPVLLESHSSSLKLSESAIRAGWLRAPVLRATLESIPVSAIIIYEALIKCQSLS